MSILISSVEHALAVAASDTVKVAKFVETSVLPVLKTAKVDESTIEAVTALVKTNERISSVQIVGKREPGAYGYARSAPSSC